MNIKFMVLNVISVLRILMPRRRPLSGQDM